MEIIYDIFYLNRSSNIHQFTSEDVKDLIYYFADDLTLTPNRIYSASNISSLFHFPRLSSLEVTDNEMFILLTIFNQSKSYPTIRKLQLDHCPDLLIRNSRQIFNTFPCLRSLSIGKVNEFDKFGEILDKFLLISPSKQALIHLCIGGLYFDDICPRYLDEEQLKTSLSEIFLPLRKRKNAYNISFNRSNRSVDIWL
jgi:hypothetical protein